MVVGKYGKTLAFQVYFKPGEKKGVKCLTFRDFKRTVSNRTNDHSRIVLKPKTEFDGPELSQMTFSITFRTDLGVDPRKMLKKLETCIRLGKIDYFVIGNKKIGKHKYLITTMTEAWDTIVKNGLLVEATVDITVKEYL